MKILLDHNLDRRLKKHLPGHDVSTALEQGWSDALNGELLSLLEANGFDVLVTADSNIKDQQNLEGRHVAVLIIRALNNRLSTHLQVISDVNDALLTVESGRFYEVFHHDFRQ